MLAIYCRESTEKQDIKTLTSMCEKEALRLGFKEWELYEDVESGYSNTRKNYLRLLNDIKVNKITNLIIYESSRLTRDELEHQIFYRLLKQNKVKLYILNRGWINLNDEDDMFLSGLLNLLDAREGRKTAKRVKDRMEEIAKNGRWTGGPAPLGYKLVDKELVIDKEKALVIKEIFNLYLKGNTRNSIAKIFNLDTKRVNRILKNPVYTGKLKFREVPIVEKKVILNKKYEILDGIHESIIDPKIFNVTQDKLKKNIKENSKKDYIFKNLLYCNCGKKSYFFQNKGKYPLDFYTCNTGCGSTTIKEHELLEDVLSKLESIINNIDVDGINKDKSKSIKELEIYTKQLKGLEKKEESLTRKFLDDKINEKLYDKFINELSGQKEFCKNKIQILNNKNMNSKNKGNNKKVLKKYFKNIKKETNPKKLNLFLNTIIDKIEFINDYRFYIHLKF